MNSENPPDKLTLADIDPALAGVISQRLTVPMHGADHILELMTRAAELAVEHVIGADHAGITIAFDGETPFTIAPTDERVQQFDNAQYELNSGPCLLAARTDKPVNVDLTAISQLWPGLASAAHHSGIGRVAASPLHRRDVSVGSLNLYTDADAADAVSHDSAVLIELLRLLDRGLDKYSEYTAAAAAVRALHESVDLRANIDRAVGVISASTDCSYDTAFARLIAKADADRIDLREAAERVIRDRGI